MFLSLNSESSYVQQLAACLQKDAVPIDMLLAVGAVLVYGYFVVAFLAVISAIGLIDAMAVRDPFAFSVSFHHQPTSIIIL